MATRKRRSVWKEEDEKELIESWEKRANDLRQAKRNAHIYHEIALEMNGKFSTEEVYIKMKNMKKKYKDQTSTMASTGCGPSDWEHYSAVRRIVEDIAVNNTTEIDIKPFSWDSTSSRLSPVSPLPLPSPSPLPARTLSPLPSISPTSTPLYAAPGSMCTKLVACRKKRTVWTEADEKELIKEWEERANDLRQAKRTAHIYNEMSLKMNGKFSTEEVHIKVKNLTKKYRDEKKKNGTSCDNPSEWKHYSAVHNILAGCTVDDGPIIESFSWNSTSSSPSSHTLSPLPSPSSPPTPLVADPLSPLNTSSTKRRKKHYSEVEKLMKQQTELLKVIADDTNILKGEIVNAIRVQNASTEKLVSLMEKLIDKI